MGIFGGVQSRGATPDGKGNQAVFRRLQNDIQIMEADLKKLEEERTDARRLKAELTKNLSLLSTRMRENERVIVSKDRAFFLLDADLKRKKRELQNQSR